VREAGHVVSGGLWVLSGPVHNPPLRTQNSNRFPHPALDLRGAMAGFNPFPICLCNGDIRHGRAAQSVLASIRIPGATVAPGSCGVTRRAGRSALRAAPAIHMDAGRRSARRRHSAEKLRSQATDTAKLVSNRPTGASPHVDISVWFRYISPSGNAEITSCHTSTYAKCSHAEHCGMARAFQRSRRVIGGPPYQDCLVGEYSTLRIGGTNNG